jgi:hypothetical protein
MTNSSVSNVTINYFYSCSKLPNDFDMNNLIITNEDYLITKEQSSVENLIISKGENQ